ncbi:adenine deaminase C-terminal domain-containing protein [Clostridium culturomicium]|uniref:adenine deaminase C-terminal domain-containing protein n=1 Tax=Clostridium culturomicium TaxID=1499683 RepID=UPI00058F26F3|nr:adenine deaminase C-terminal domain-containing protein [Clostridium culturomicium]
MRDNKVDLIIKNINVYNSYLKSFQLADVSILNGKILHIDKNKEAELTSETSVDGTGKYMIPGLIDIHMHIESSMMVPETFCNHVAKCGITTLVAEPHEMANVMGYKGITDMIEAGENCDIDIFIGIPSCVPSTSDVLETTGGIIDFSTMEELKKLEKVICVGEVMNYRQIIQENDLEITKFLTKLREEDKNFPIEGHCPSLMGLDLSKFLYLGINADHTEHSFEEIKERFENGMFIEIQEKMLKKEILEYIHENNLYEHFGFVTDDVMADTLLEQGQLDGVMRKAINLGMRVEDVIYNSTFTNARRMNLLDRGAIAPGKLADFVLLEDLNNLKVYATYKAGKCIFHKNFKSNLNENESYRFPGEYYKSINMPELTEEAFKVKANINYGYVTVRAMEIKDGSTKTEEKHIKLKVENGYMDWENSECRLAVVVERYGKNKGVGYGFVCGDVIKTGAAATSYAHDSHNVLVIGANIKDMSIALHSIDIMQGGMVVVENLEIKGALQLNVGGILSDKPIENISRDLKMVRNALIKQGYKHYNPIMSLSTITLPVSPKLKLTDKGLVDVVSGTIVSLVVE